MRIGCKTQPPPATNKPSAEPPGEKPKRPANNEGFRRVVGAAGVYMGVGSWPSDAVPSSRKVWGVGLRRGWPHIFCGEEIQGKAKKIIRFIAFEKQRFG